MLPLKNMATEVLNSTASYTHEYVLTNQEDFLKTILENPGRFKSLVTPYDRIRFRFLQFLSKGEALLGKSQLVMSRTVPPNWQLLLDYLFEHKITSSRHIYLHEGRNDYPEMYKTSLPLVTSLTEKGGKNQEYAYGTSTVSLLQSLSKTVGEALERHFFRLSPTSDFITASVNELVQGGGTFLDISKIPGFTKHQQANPRLRWDKDTLFNWVEGKELLSSKKTFLPAQLVFWDQIFSIAGTQEPYLRNQTTNGAGGHFTYEAAVLSAVYENVERDAFLIYWLRNIPPRRIALRTINDESFQSFVAELKRCHLELILLETHTDIAIPACVAVIVDRSTRGPSISVGGVAGFNILPKLQHAAEEALSVHMHLANDASMQYILPDNYVPFTMWTIGKRERLALWKDPTMFTHLQQFLSGPEISFEEFARHDVKNFSNAQEELHGVLDQFRKKGSGYEVYIYECRSPILTRVGYHVVRSIVPALLPLYLTENLATLEATRLESVPRYLGVPVQNTTTMNPLPHPYP